MRCAIEYLNFPNLPGQASGRTHNGKICPETKFELSSSLGSDWPVGGLFAKIHYIKLLHKLTFLRFALDGPLNVDGF